MRIGSIVFEENNLKIIQILIGLEDQYGQAIVQQAAKQIAEKNPDNRVPRMRTNLTNVSFVSNVA